MDNELNLLSMDMLEQAAECLKVMGHPVRLRIVDILMQGEFPVRDIAALCETTPDQTCEHLRLMKSHGFLGSERRGKMVYYSIAHPNLSGLLECVRKNCGCGK